MTGASPRSQRFIRRIYVSKLFDQYTYDLHLDSDEDKIDPRLLILYGDNGSGKTTLLRTIFYLHSSQDKRGHKSYIAKTIFREFKIELSDGTVVLATRPEGNIVGAFRMSISKRNKLRAQVDWKVDENLDVLGKFQDPKRRDHILSTLAALDLNLYFLSDDRGITRSPDDRPEQEISQRHSRFTLTAQGTMRRLRDRSGGSESPAARGVLAAIAQVMYWATGRALEGSTKGNADANALYANIVHHISAASRERSKIKKASTRENLIEELHKQAARSVAFSKYGLIGPLAVEPFVKVLGSASGDTLSTLQNVIEPYIDSVKARLDALEPLHDTINSFCQILNSFYKNKSVHFDLRNGISLQTLSNSTIPPTGLSSGERHLLLLLCNILVARDNQSIFIIDEPELSLNVKWQRRLVSTLLDFTSRSPIQFILATHSVELLSQHSSSVMNLNSSPVL